MNRRLGRHGCEFCANGRHGQACGATTVREERPQAEVSKGLISFGDGDFLFSTITLCLEIGKVAVSSEPDQRH